MGVKKPTAVINYLDHIIEIKLDSPDEGNDIKIAIHSIYYEPEDSSQGYLTDYQFSAESPNPNKWLLEAIDSAIWQLNNRGVRFSDYNPKSEELTEIDESIFEF